MTAIKPVKNRLPETFLRQSVRKLEIRRAHRLDRWRQLRRTRPKGDKKRAEAWKLFRKTDEQLRLRRGQLLYREHHKQLTPRQKTVRHAKSFAGKVTENPPGSNKGGLITRWQLRLGAWLLGLAWCGTFCANMLLAGGVKGVSARLASVALIEDDARAGSGPFTAWTTFASQVKPGDLAVLFGRGIHVELVVEVDLKRGVIKTVGGNTSSGSGGSQSNGGGVYSRTRPLSAVHGFALVRYP